MISTMKNNTEKKEHGKDYHYITFIISVILFFVTLLATTLAFNVKDISDKIIQVGITSQMPMELYQNSQGERKLNINKTSIAKSIAQFNNMENNSKPNGLLLLAGQVNISLFGLHNINGDVAFFAQNQNNDEFMKIYKESLDKTKDSDIAIYQKYLSQLVQHYKDLPQKADLGNTYLAKTLDKHSIISNDYVNDKTLLTLYSLDSNIKNWRKIKEIHSQGFDVDKFLKDNQGYWDESFSKTHGKDIPEYLSLFYNKDTVDLSTAKSWINNFK